MNTSTCLTSGAAGFTPGPVSFDPANGVVYVADTGSKAVGIVRFHVLASGDSGHGLLDGTRIGIVGSGCGLGGNLPTAATLGPDSNLYVGFKKIGSIVRILKPQSDPVPCTNVVTVGATSTGRGDSGLGWLGHDLIGLDGGGPFIIAGADACATLGNGPCVGLTFDTGLIVGATSVVTDQLYPQTNGTSAYFVSPTSVAKHEVLPLQLLNASFASGYTNATGMTYDPVQQRLWVGDDPGVGGVAGATGRWFEVSAPAIQPAAPATPVNVFAVPGDSQAVVNWTAGDSQPVISLTVRTLRADGAPSLVPDSFNPPTAAVSVTGLTNGVAYVFRGPGGQHIRRQPVFGSQPRGDASASGSSSRSDRRHGSGRQPVRFGDLDAAPCHTDPSQSEQRLHIRPIRSVELCHGGC